MIAAMALHKTAPDSSDEGVDEEANSVKYNAQGKVKGKRDKPKPWDTLDIDHWKVERFDPTWNDGGMLEESSFSTLFPQYREKYLQEVWPLVTKALKESGVACKLNLVEGSMTVSTTRKTRDPYIIVKARDLIKLLSRSVPAPQALKILDDEMQCDIIKIGNIIRNKERFVKRRQRLLGPNGATLKQAIELLTGCYVLVQGNTVSAMGSFKGLKNVRRIVEDCIRNIHPIYHIKALMVKRELAKDPELATQNWERFLPKFKKKNVKQKKTKKEKKSYTPFPPPQQPSKIDLQLESGEYFLNAEKRAARKWDEKKEKQAEKAITNKQKRDAAFVPPKEERTDQGKAGKNTTGVSNSEVASMAAALKKKTQTKAGHFSKKDGQSVDAYLAVPGSGSMKSKVQSNNHLDNDAPSYKPLKRRKMQDNSDMQSGGKKMKNSSSPE
ncbi:hypothetical protein O6H91_10G094400 [Diphasiastrum complanatum]|uniref:Uncharacterized protein n=1 Tax=Diphasiastrum complanatum TaxID=34168 RepID=A0ACC2CKH1_DIPCM|nr:hypothetical protein O6H91_10G094400 [Diphasiastrum complanatum]